MPYSYKLNKYKLLKAGYRGKMYFDLEFLRPTDSVFFPSAGSHSERLNVFFPLNNNHLLNPICIGGKQIRISLNHKFIASLYYSFLKRRISI